MLEKEAVSKSKFQVSARPFLSWHRSTLTEILLSHACSCSILRTETAGQEISVALGKEIEYHKRAVESLQDKQVLGCCHAHTLLVAVAADHWARRPNHGGGAGRALGGWHLVVAVVASARSAHALCSFCG